MDRSSTASNRSVLQSRALSVCLLMFVSSKREDVEALQHVFQELAESSSSATFTQVD